MASIQTLRKKMLKKSHLDEFLLEQKLNEKLLKDRYERAESMDVFAEIGTPPELEDGEEEEPLTDVDEDSEPETEEPDIEEFVGLLTEEGKAARERQLAKTSKMVRRHARMLHEQTNPLYHGNNPTIKIPKGSNETPPLPDRADTRPDDVLWLYGLKSYEYKRQRKIRLFKQLVNSEDDDSYFFDPCYREYLRMLRTFYWPYGCRDRDIKRVAFILYYIDSRDAEFLFMDEEERRDAKRKLKRRKRKHDGNVVPSSPIGVE